MVLLAGLGNTAWIWSDFGPRLAREGFRVLALTRRAHGEMIADASRAAPEYDRVRAPALALYATVSQAIAPADATPEQRAQLARFERENNEPWTAGSIAQFRAGVLSGRVARIAGVHHLFLDRPDETLRAIVPFPRAPASATRR